VLPNAIQQILTTLKSGHIFSELALAQITEKNESSRSRTRKKPALPAWAFL
jgi:hypothetical protein